MHQRANLYLWQEGKRLVQDISEADERAAIDGAEDAYQRRWQEMTPGSVGYPNMKVEAIFDSKVKELSPHKDLTGYSRIVFGKGKDTVTANVNSGKLVLTSQPHYRIVVIPMNSGQVMIEARPL